MKPLALLFALVFVGNSYAAELKVIERPQPGAGYVAFQAIIRADLTGEDDLAGWDLMGLAMLQGTEDYSADEISILGSQAGVSPSVVAMPGYFRLEMAAPSSSAEQVARIFAQCLVSPKLRQDGIDLARANLLSKNSRPFDRSLRLADLPWEKVTADKLRNLYERTVRPESIEIYVSGDIEIGVVPAAMSKETRRWEPVAKPRPGRLQAEPRPVTDSGSSVASFELRAEQMTPNSRFAAARLLAVMALGVAKDCTMHRVLRDREGLSYAQEAVLWPTQKGWLPRFIMLRDGGKIEDLAFMRKLMIDDVDTWTESTLKRAIVLGQASLSDGLAWSPVYLGPGRTMASNILDRTALFAYLDMVGAGGVTADVWSKTLENVDLETMKAQAKEMLDKASGIYLPPRNSTLQIDSQNIKDAL